MAKKLPIQVEVGDYIIETQTGHRRVFKVTLINYLEGRITVKPIYPRIEGLSDQFSVRFENCKSFELLAKDIGNHLYG